MAKLKFKDENDEFIPVVQDVKVNNNSVFDGKDANINLKTINNQSIVGTGNVSIDVENVVKTTANQGLTNQQKTNARANIEALGTENIKQSTGNSTTDIISQKGVTDLLSEKQDNMPDGTHLLISNDTGKIDLIYIPSTVLGGITNGGTFNGNGIITASSYAPELQGLVIDEVEFASYPSYYFICSAPYSFAGFEFAVGDWAISLGNGWAKLNATDAVTSVNNKMGQVVLNYDDVGATKKSWGIDNANKNLVTDAQGNVITSDYALGQIIVDYYEELPTNVPATAKASVIKSSGYMAAFTEEEIQDSINNGTVYSDFFINETLTRPTAVNSYVGVNNETVSLDMGYSMSGGELEPVYSMGYTDENGISHDYYYSFIQQAYAYSGEETVYLQVGWNEILYDEETGEPYVVQIQYSDLPTLTDFAFISYGDEDTGFINSFGHTAYHLAGEYMYVETQPSTTPKTYYWKYNPANVQSDMSEDDPASLAYIKNRTILDTTGTSSIPTGTETIKNTIYLHKISKTGRYNDLISAVGRTSGNGEKLGDYSTNFSRGIYGLSTGSNTQAEGNYSRCGGYYSRASGEKSVAEGYGAVATGEGANARNINTLASGKASSAEGDTTVASGLDSHAEGAHTEASNNCTHAEGYYCVASGEFSHAEGYFTEAKSSYAHSQNYGTIARYCQTAIGKYNVEDTQSTQAFIIGGGTDILNRANIHTVDWNGNAWFKGDIRVGGTSWDTGTPVGGGGSTAKKKTLTNASQNYSVSNNVVTVTDNDVSTDTMIMLYPSDTATETWLENNLSSCIITEATGSFSFSINSNLPSTFSMYYIIMEVE